MMDYSRRRKMRRGQSRHTTLQRSLCNKKRVTYVKSLHDTLIKLGVDLDKTQTYHEVPLPKMGNFKDKKSSRVDMILYVPGQYLITIEYKTTEVKPPIASNFKLAYVNQVERSTRNLMKVLEYASDRGGGVYVNNNSTISTGPKLIQLLTIRNYHDSKQITDTTEQIGDSNIQLPNLNYKILIRRLKNQMLLTW